MISTRISIQACVRLNSLVIIDVVVIVLVVVVGFTMRVCCSLDVQEYISWGSDRFSLADRTPTGQILVIPANTMNNTFIRW